MCLTVEQINIRLEDLRQIENSLRAQRDELLGLRETLEESLRTGKEPF